MLLNLAACKDKNFPEWYTNIGAADVKMNGSVLEEK